MLQATKTGFIVAYSLAITNWGKTRWIILLAEIDGNWKCESMR